MCKRCQAEATGLRSGRGTAVLSKLMGMYACKHSPDCDCKKCNQYREDNRYADTGLFLKREIKE